MRSALLSNADQVGITGSPRVAGMAPVVEQSGDVRWSANKAHAFGGRFTQRVNGAIGSNVADQYFAAFLTGGASTFSPIGVSGKYPAAGRLSTGTGTADTASQCGAGVVGGAGTLGDIWLSASSGTWTYETIFRISTNSDGTDTFAVYYGFLANRSAVPVNGCYLKADANNNANFQLVTAINSTRTTSTTGVAITAGTWYKMKIVITNNSTVSLFVVAYGSAYGAADATNTTNIPTAITRIFGVGAVIIKAAGTTARTTDFVYQYANQTGIPTGFTSPATVTSFGFGAMLDGDGPNIAAGIVGSSLAIDSTGALAWRDAYTPDDNIPVYAYCKGTPTSDEWIAKVSGSGTAAAIPGTPPDGQFGVTEFSTGTTSTGRAGMWAFDATTGTIYFDADSGTIVYETMFKLPVLSSGTQTHKLYCGFVDASAPANGAWMEIDTNANGNMQCKTMAASTATTTDSGVTIATDTLYWMRIVVATNGSVKFYIKANGTALGAAVATHTTNIPSAALLCGSQIVKSVGTTARLAHSSFQLLHQRRV